MRQFDLFGRIGRFFSAILVVEDAAMPASNGSAFVVVHDEHALKVFEPAATDYRVKADDDDRCEDASSAVPATRRFVRCPFRLC